MPVEEQVVVDLRRHPRLPRRRRPSPTSRRFEARAARVVPRPPRRPARRASAPPATSATTAFEARSRRSPSSSGPRSTSAGARAEAQADAEPHRRRRRPSRASPARTRLTGRPRTEPMAGGQERVLRRRIKSVQTTKKITRAMELIAATRVVQGPAARRRGAALQPSRSPRSSRTSPPAAADVDHPLLRQADEVRTRRLSSSIAADRGLAGAYNTVGHPRRRARDHGRPSSRASDYALSPSAKAEGYFRFRHYQIDASLHRHQRQAQLRGRPRSRRARHRALRVRRRRPGAASSTPSSSRSACSEVVAGASCRSRRRGRVDGGADGRAGAAVGRFEFEPVAGGGARRAAAPLRRGPRCSPPCSRPRHRSTPPPAGHEVRHRQRRGAHHNAQPQMNRARQDAITTEIMEIVGGAEALRPGRRRGRSDAGTSTSPRDLDSPPIAPADGARSDRRPNAMTVTETSS